MIRSIAPKHNLYMPDFTCDNNDVITVITYKLPIAASNEKQITPIWCIMNLPTLCTCSPKLMMGLKCFTSISSRIGTLNFICAASIRQLHYKFEEKSVTRHGDRLTAMYLIDLQILTRTDYCDTKRKKKKANCLC